MPTQVQINGAAQFNQFVDFAKLAEQAGNTKAIARVSTSDGDTTTLRAIGTTTDDKVFAIRRSPDNKQANDAARTLFRKRGAHPQERAGRDEHEGLRPRQAAHRAPHQDRQ